MFFLIVLGLSVADVQGIYQAVAHTVSNAYCIVKSVEDARDADGGIKPKTFQKTYAKNLDKLKAELASGGQSAVRTFQGHLYQQPQLFSAVQVR